MKKLIIIALVFLCQNSLSNENIIKNVEAKYIFYYKNMEAGKMTLKINTENNKIYGEANLRYRNRFGAHRLDAILIGTYEKNMFRSLFNKAIGYGSDNTSFYNFSSATEIYVPISEFREVGLLSSVLRIGYNYKRKYYVDFNTRIDASSKFAVNNQSAIFPSVALSWVISKEKFLRQVDEVSQLKLRFSGGQTGSNPISPYQSLSLLSPIRYNFENDLAIGYFESNLANNDLTWEKTDQFNNN